MCVVDVGSRSDQTLHDVQVPSLSRHLSGTPRPSRSVVGIGSMNEKRIDDLNESSLDGREKGSCLGGSFFFFFFDVSSSQDQVLDLRGCGDCEQCDGKRRIYDL